MTEGLRPVHEGRDRRAIETERKVFDGARGTYAYSHVKAGVPTDSDYGVPPPVGFYVLDTVGLKVYFRVAVGSWKATAALT